MGQVLYHSGKMSTRASGFVKIQPSSGQLSMNPKDIEHLGLNETSHVTVSSGTGSVRLRMKPDHNVMPGTCFYPEHFNDPPVKDLMTVEADQCDRSAVLQVNARED